MTQDPVFRAGRVKRAFGWFVIVGTSAILIELANATWTHWERLDATELWSAAGIALFVGMFLLGGFAILSIRWVIQQEAIVLHGRFTRKTFDLSDIGGFGTLITVAGVFPFAHIQLYDRQLRPIAGLPIDHRDLPLAEAWLGQRFRRVVNDGSLALPRYRFADDAE